MIDISETQAGETFEAKLAGLPCSALSDLGRSYLTELEGLPGRGELPVVTDKMPDNFPWVGLIKLLFPEARVIHCFRQPLDNCWSIYKNLFGTGHNYAYDLGELGAYYVQYARVMDHWRRLLPGYMHEISYETLVADTEKEVRVLLDYCGLDWDVRCLDFHRTERVGTDPELQSGPSTDLP